MRVGIVALSKIGANAWLLKELRADEDRTDAIKEAFATFAAVMGFEKLMTCPELNLKKTMNDLNAVNAADRLLGTQGCDEK